MLQRITELPVTHSTSLQLPARELAQIAEHLEHANVDILAVAYISTPSLAPRLKVSHEERRPGSYTHLATRRVSSSGQPVRTLRSQPEGRPAANRRAGSAHQDRPASAFEPGTAITEGFLRHVHEPRPGRRVAGGVLPTSSPRRRGRPGAPMADVVIEIERHGDGTLLVLLAQAA